MTQPVKPADPAAIAPLRSRMRVAIEAAWTRATDAGVLPTLAAPDRPAIDVERPAHPEHGDLATNLAMKLARPCRMAPLRIAEALAAELAAEAARPGSVVGTASVAAPGFLNLRIAGPALAEVVAGVLAQPAT